MFDQRWILAALIGLVNPLARAKVSCHTESAGTIIKTIDLPNNPNYFLRASRSTREVSFASAGPEKNQILNVDTGQRTSVPGSIDPVLADDGKMLSVPQSVIQDKNGLQVATPDLQEYDYRISGGEVQDKSGKTVEKRVEEVSREGKKLLYDDALVLYNRDPSGKLTPGFIEPNAGNYQTVGIRKSNDQESIYRMLVGQGAHLVTRDYRRDARTGAITPATELRPACSNVGVGGLPILSPDGSAFSYYDVEGGDTRIMAFNDHGGCDRIDAIPALIGKPDFSPDGRYLAFHMDQKIKFKNAIFSVPEKDQKLGIYLYDRQTKSLSLLHDQADTNSYYPVFLNNREIAFIEGSGDPDQPKFAIRLMKIGTPRGYACRGCNDTEDLRAASGLLGAIYGARCGIPDLSAGNATIGLARLSAEDCRALTSELKDEDVASAQAKFDARVDWDVAMNKKTMQELKLVKKESRFVKPLHVRDLASICPRLGTDSTNSPATSAQ